MNFEEYQPEDDPYRDDPEGFRRLGRAEYEALSDDEAWAYLKAWTDAEGRRRARRQDEETPSGG
jgi:hypothetical protein